MTNGKNPDFIRHTGEFLFLRTGQGGGLPPYSSKGLGRAKRGPDDRKLRSPRFQEESGNGAGKMEECNIATGVLAAHQTRTVTD